MPPFRNTHLFEDRELRLDEAGLVREVSTNFVYTTEYLKLRVGKQSTAIELRSLNGKIVSRNADMLSSVTDCWCEVDVDQLNNYRTQFPVVKSWLKLIRQR